MLKKHNQTGFTLIELMIASSLLMLVLYAGYFAYSLYNNSWQKQSNAYWKAADQGIKLNSLTRVISSAQPYIVEDINQKPSVFFEGSNKTIRFVSTATIFSEGIGLVELAIVNNQLIYRESNIEQSPFLKQDELREWQHNVVLLTDIKNTGFNFFGWEGLNQLQEHKLQLEAQTRTQVMVKPAWYERHEMKDRRVFPILISFKFTNKLEQEISINFKISQHSQFALFRYLRIDV